MTATPALRVREAAERLGLSVWMIRQLIADGKLHAYQLRDNTSPWLIPETSITEYEKEHLSHDD